MIQKNLKEILCLNTSEVQTGCTSLHYFRPPKKLLSFPNNPFLGWCTKLWKDKSKTLYNNNILYFTSDRYTLLSIVHHTKKYVG